MDTIIQSSNINIILCSTNKARRLKKQQLNQPKHQKTNTKLSYPKPSPTPLLHNHKPYSQTKLQSLTAIVDDIENSTKKGLHIDIEIFASLLETCYKLQAIDHGVRIHSLIPSYTLRKNVGLSSKLLRLYASNGLIEDAHQVFDEMSTRNESAFAWNSLISGYAELGFFEDALALYHQMVEEGVDPDRFTFPRVLKACAGIGSIRIGENVLKDIVRFGFALDGFVLNALVDMYAKCGDIVKARKVFNKIDCKDLVSWNSMMTGYIRHGLLVEAIAIFRLMIKDGFEPDSVAISSILSGISSRKIGVEIHGWILRHGIEWNLSITNALIVDYAKYGKRVHAQWLFNQMPDRDIVSWNSIIVAHSKNPDALTYFELMENARVLPDSVTFVSLLSTCAQLGLVKEGQVLFSKMKECYDINPSMEHYACMVNLYGRAGMISDAYEMITTKMGFDAGSTVWGALLYACYMHGDVDVGEVAAYRLFDMEPDNELNFDLIMNLYGKKGRLDDVERVRKMMVDRGLDL